MCFHFLARMAGSPIEKLGQPCGFLSRSRLENGLDVAVVDPTLQDMKSAERSLKKDQRGERAGEFHKRRMQTVC